MPLIVDAELSIFDHVNCRDVEASFYFEGTDRTCNEVNQPGGLRKEWCKKAYFRLLCPVTCGDCEDADDYYSYSYK